MPGPRGDHTTRERVGRVAGAERGRVAVHDRGRFRHRGAGPERLERRRTDRRADSGRAVIAGPRVTLRAIREWARVGAVPATIDRTEAEAVRVAAPEPLATRERCG